MKLSQIFSRKKSNTGSGALPGLPEGGQSAAEFPNMGISEHLRHSQQFFSSYSEVHHLLDELAASNPDISQSVFQMASLGNPGHDLHVTDSRARVVDSALQSLNALAGVIYDFGVGADAVINQMIFQQVIHGALSAEICLKPDFSGVRRVITVPVASVFFKLEDGAIRPMQRTAGREIPLNPITYHYYRYLSKDNDIYAIPPILAALETTMYDREMMGLAKKIFTKLDTYGMNIMQVPPPPPERADMTSSEYARQHTSHIRNFMSALSASLRSGTGFVGIPKDVTPVHHPFTSNIEHIGRFFDLVERRIFSGLKSDAGWHGKPLTRSETYLAVLYRVLERHAQSMRQAVKRFLEAAYKIHLYLEKNPVETLSIKFRTNSDLDPKNTAETEKIIAETTFLLLEKGMIDFPTAAQRCGFTKYANPAQLAATEKTFSWNPNANRYEFQAPSLGSLTSRKYSEEEDSIARANIAKEKLEKNIRRLLEVTLPYFHEANEELVEFAVEYTLSHAAEISGEDGPVKLLEAVREYARSLPAYALVSNPECWIRKKSAPIFREIMVDYLTLDDTVFPGSAPKVNAAVQFGEGDETAAKFFERLNSTYLSMFVNNNINQDKIRELLAGLFSANADGIHIRDAEIREFHRLFGEEVAEFTQYQCERIIRGSVTRMRTYAHIEKLFQNKFKYGKINNQSEGICPICQKLRGTKVYIKTAGSIINKFIALDDTEKIQAWLKRSGLDPEADPSQHIEEVQAGVKIPPFHVNCVCFIEGYFSEDL